MPENKNDNTENIETADIADAMETAENTESIEDTETAEDTETPPKRSGSGFTDSIFGTAAVLGIITLITALVLAALQSFTAPVIEKRLNAEKEESVAELFGEGIHTETLGGFEDIYSNFSSPVSEVLFVKDVSSGEIRGYCVTVNPKGFGGKITMLVAVNPDVTVRDTKILSMSETAGQGTKIDSEKWFRDQFKYKTTNITAGINGENVINTIAGATVSSKAFLSGVNSALAVINEIAGRNTDG